MELRKKIRALRKKKGLSQGELAAAIDMNPSHISRLETGKYQPSVDALQRLATALDVTPDFLLKGEDSASLEVQIQDKSFSERLRLIEMLDEADRQALIQVIDSMLTKQRMKQLLQSGVLQEAG